MTKKIAAAAALLLGAAGWWNYLRGGMGAAEAVRRLSGLRVAVELYRQQHAGRPPASFGETLRSGELESVPDLKLPGHPRRAGVRDTASAAVSDTGGWAYVNDPKSPDFGLVYIDCSHSDAKGRFWSEF
ncbi:MAG: hypothetical protein M0025_11745 [Elusimicrobia bacterium]|nr:hypothetical protein [Elusimicrobiota bacterium]